MPAATAGGSARTVALEDAYPRPRRAARHAQASPISRRLQSARHMGVSVRSSPLAVGGRRRAFQPSLRDYLDQVPTVGRRFSRPLSPLGLPLLRSSYSRAAAPARDLGLAGDRAEHPPRRLTPPEGIGCWRCRAVAPFFVCDALPHGKDLEPLLLAALAGGSGIVELRTASAPGRRIERSARTFRRLADIYSAPSSSTTTPTANELDADGVHVGQEDASGDRARDPRPDALIGLSTHSPEQVVAAHAQPVDYISVGPVWETLTKEGRAASASG